MRKDYFWATDEQLYQTLKAQDAAAKAGEAKIDAAVAAHGAYYPFKPQHEVAGCPTCEKYKGQMHPSHDASPRCESGKHPHCSCDICFD